MQKVNGFVQNGGDTEYLFTYSEKEKQENEVNKENAKLVFNWKYLVVPREVFELGLSGNDALIYSFIHSFIGQDNRFYFTNEQLSGIFNVSSRTVTDILAKLATKGLIDLSYKRKSDGGQIRFVNLPTSRKFQYQLAETASSYSQNLLGNYNNINNNSINKGEREETSLTHPKSNFNSIKTLTEETVGTIAKDYGVSTEFVLDCKENMELWLGSKGKTYKDYNLALRNWVKKDRNKKAYDLAMLSKKRGGVYDASNRTL